MNARRLRNKTAAIVLALALLGSILLGPCTAWANSGDIISIPFLCRLGVSAESPDSQHDALNHVPRHGHCRFLIRTMSPELAQYPP